MRESFNFKDKSFAVYGLGLTGKSVVKFLKKNNIDNVFIWDDFILKTNLKLKSRFIKKLNFVDFIVLSPGIIFKSQNLKIYF